jgi:hypothetical protein
LWNCHRINWICLLKLASILEESGAEVRQGEAKMGYKGDLQAGTRGWERREYKILNKVKTVK